MKSSVPLLDFEMKLNEMTYKPSERRTLNQSFASLKAKGIQLPRDAALRAFVNNERGLGLSSAGWGAVYFDWTHLPASVRMTYAASEKAIFAPGAPSKEIDPDSNVLETIENLRSRDRSESVVPLLDFEKNESYWSAEVTAEVKPEEHPRPGIFAKGTVDEIVEEMCRLSEGNRTTATAKLTFYMNRAGKNLSLKRLDVIETARLRIQEQGC
jgi:hypothetical protein